MWTYTHAWRSVSRASWGDVHVFASCETAHDVAWARVRGYASAIVVPEFDDDRVFLMDAGVRVVPCPAQTRHTTCVECRLCMNEPARYRDDLTIGFAVHGTNFTVKRAVASLTDPDNPGRRLGTRAMIPALLAEDPTMTNRQMAERIGCETSSVWEMRHRLMQEGVI